MNGGLSLAAGDPGTARRAPNVTWLVRDGRGQDAIGIDLRQRPLKGWCSIGQRGVLRALACLFGIGTIYSLRRD